MFFTVNIVYLTLIFLLIIFVYLYLTRNFNHWKNKNIYYIKPVLLLGNVYKLCTLQCCIGEFVRDIYKSTKLPFIGFFVFDKPFLLIRDPELIKQCLIKDFDYFDDRSIIENKRDDELGSNILFVLKNPAWRHVRARFTPVFSTGKIKGMLRLTLEASDDLINYIHNIATKSDATEARDLCMKYTTDVISSCAYGVNAHCFVHKSSQFRETSRRLFDWGFGRKIAMASYFFAPTLVKLFRFKLIEPNAAQFITDVFKAMTVEREKSNAYRGDLIDSLMQIRNKSRPGPYQLEGQTLLAQAAQFYVAGIETTAATISYGLYELSLNLDIQNRLREEILSILSKYHNITYEAIKEMNYLDMVVKETLRKYPVLPFLDRRCTKPYKIPGTDVLIEKGIPIYISLLGLHYDQEYFSNPEKFEPERFSADNIDTIPSFCYMPFGQGPHNCIGKRFGLLITKIALIRILVEFEVEVCKLTQVPLTYEPTGFVIAPEKGLNLRFKKKM